MLVHKVLFQFSQRTGRQTTPRIFRDPKYVNAAVIKKKKQYPQYNLSSPYLKNSHLYYNKAIDDALEKQRNQEIFALNHPFPPVTEARSRESMLQELLDPFVRKQCFDRVLYNIQHLEKHESQFLS